MSQETSTEKLRGLCPAFFPASIPVQRAPVSGVLRHTRILSSQPSSYNIGLVQLTFPFIICFYILATCQGSASCFATHKLQDWKLLKIQKCQKFGTLGGEINGGIYFTEFTEFDASWHGSLILASPLSCLSFLNFYGDILMKRLTKIKHTQ